jgi:DNA-binding HxlR family transcriptional regulator
MDVLARPWAGLILCALQERPLRFSELHAQLEVIGDRMLSCRLKELEAEGLVQRRVHPDPPIRVEYALTEAGRGFGEVHAAISRWGELLLAHHPEGAVERTGPETAPEAEPESGAGAAARGR